MKTNLVKTSTQNTFLTLLFSLLLFLSPLNATNDFQLSEQEKEELNQSGIITRELETSDRSGKTLVVISRVNASKAILTNVITDYERYPEFMPNVSQVEVVGHDSLETHLNFTLTLALGIVKKYRIAISEKTLSEQLSKIAWHSQVWPGLKPSETIKETTGHWLIQEQTDGSSIVLYKVYTDPGAIPWGFGWIVDLLTESSVPDVLVQTRIQAEKVMDQQISSTKRVLFVVTSNNQLGETGKQTGYYFSEVTHPYFQIVDAGFEVDIASPKGGLAPMDKSSLKLKDDRNRRFYENLNHMSKLEQTLLLSDVVPRDYSAILFVGGHGGMWDFPQNETISRLTANIYENGGITAAVCHGPAALVDIKLSDDSYLVAGKTVTSFTNDEEAVKDLTEAMPFLLESKLIERGAIFTKSGIWQKNVVISDRLITGQNPASAEAVGQAIVQLLETQ